MTTKAAALPLVVAAVILAGVNLLPGCFAPTRTESKDPEPAPAADTTSASQVKSEEPAVTRPRSPRRPVEVSKKSDPEEDENKPASKPADKPTDRSTVPANLVLKRLKTPPLDVPKGRIHIPATNSVAINNEGTRVIVENHPAVDIWDTVKLSLVRVQPEPVGGLGGGAIIAQDASRVYVRNDTGKKVDTYNGDGLQIGSGPLIGFAPPFGLKRPGYDFARRDYVMGSRLPAECGVFLFDADDGALRNVVKIKDIWDVERCSGLVRVPGGDFLAYYNPKGANTRGGLHALARDGTLTKVPGIPSKDMKIVNDLAISPDGRRLAVRGADRLEVWDLQDKKLVLDWRQEYRTPLAARFTGDGRLAVLSVKTSIQEIATSGRTGGWVNHSARLDVLEVPSLRVAGELNLAEFDALTPAFAFSPNGKRLVVADWKQAVLIDVDHAFPGK